MCHLYGNVITGNFVNFAICEYYNDTIFTQFSQTVLCSIVRCGESHQELQSYAKVYKKTLYVTLQFFSNHLELLFTKFDAELIEQLLRFLLKAMSQHVFETQTDACGALNLFNEFLFEQLSIQNPPPKQQELVSSVKQFF